MSLLKCYLVDDEMSAVESLTLLLQAHCKDVKVLGFSINVSNAQQFLATNEVDILFIDIKMKGETGFDLLKEIPNFEGSIIFVTAFDEYGLQAIKFSATDYLLKPVDISELKAAIEKCKSRKALLESRKQIAMLIQSFENQKKTQQKKIALADAEEVRYVMIDEIIYCQANNSYTTFFLTGKKKIMVSKPIADYESLLEPYGFVRTHQSYLVNKNRITSFKKEDGGYLLMEEGATIPISRQRKHLVRDIF